MPHITIPSPAKLNLHLRVGDRRPDGFHDIDSLFLALAFGDTLVLETTPYTDSLEICMNWRTELPSVPDLPPERNIVFKAVSLFRSRTGYDKGLKVTVEKRIPLGGGLGGGSSNAAATLAGLNRLAAASGDNRSLPDTAALAEMGAALGSDVPFFLNNASAAWVGGRGELVRPVTVPASVSNLFVVLVNPGFSSDTAEAFRLLDEYRHKEGGVVDLLNESYKNRVLLQRSFAESPRNWPFVNDFLPVFETGTSNNASSGNKSTVYRHIISGLRSYGADFSGLSGSGSTCFGVFFRQNKAEIAKNALSKHWPFVIETFPLAHRYTVC